MDRKGAAHPVTHFLTGLSRRTHFEALCFKLLTSPMVTFSLSGLFHVSDCRFLKRNSQRTVSKREGANFA